MISRLPKCVTLGKHSPPFGPFPYRNNKGRDESSIFQIEFYKTDNLQDSNYCMVTRNFCT